MCFAIPYKVFAVKNGSAIIENGKVIKLGKEIKAAPGDYLQVIGNIATGALSAKQGKKIRSLIKQINLGYASEY